MVVGVKIPIILAEPADDDSIWELMIELKKNPKLGYENNVRRGMALRSFVQEIEERFVD